jgi:hypothetical protein
METIAPAFFHKLYGIKKTRIFYSKKDFLDYVLMLLMTAAVVGFSYGFRSVMAGAGFALCAIALAMFVRRHGVELQTPVILRRPQDILYMFIYKLGNLRLVYFAALALLLLENAAIAATPGLPHHADSMRKAGLVLFYAHFLGITIYRTAIFVDHFRKREYVREVLMQTPWKRVINEKTNITVEVIHAYCTGLLTHIVLIAPWYLVIQHARFSLVFLPAVFVLDALIHMRWVKAVNSWFYRDHWLGHNSELEFLFLHGPHHDAIPTGMIAVAGNGFLEGFLRFTIGSPVALYNPVVSFLAHTFEVKTDIDLHQYIPGMFPRLPRRVLEVGQHSTHHYGKLEPYSFGLKLDKPELPESYKKQFARVPDELMNSLKLDEELTGFQWDNPTHQNTLSLWDKYQPRRRKAQP